MAGQMVSFPSNGASAEGYLALPAGGKGPGVIVIQEWWGLVPHIKSVADRLAAQGYVALAPDLYHGKATKEPDEAGKMMMALNMDQAAKDMGGAYDYVRSNPACTGKVGSVGFCMGGGLSLTIAAKRPIDACVDYYGIADGAKLGGLKAPVLGHFAENDGWAGPEAVGKLAQGLRDIGTTVQFHTYPGTEHAFFNDARPEVYNASAANLSWDRTLAFFSEHLT
jgi:carboxymethylenebutenolidase